MSGNNKQCLEEFEKWHELKYGCKPDLSDIETGSEYNGYQAAWSRRTQLVEMEKNAVRYQFLRNQAVYQGGIRPVVWLTQSHEGDTPDSHITWLDYEDLDEAIDKARSINKED